MRHSPAILLGLLLLAPVALADAEPGYPFGPYDLVLTKQGQTAKSHAYVEVVNDTLVLTSDDNEHLRMVAQRERTGGSFVFRRVRAVADGLAQGVEGRHSGSTVYADVLTVSAAADGQWSGNMTRDGEQFASAMLAKRKRLLLITSSYRKWNQKYTSYMHGRGVKNAYEGRGYTTVEKKIDSFEDYIALLNSYRRDPFLRVVQLVHSGAEDGPVFAFTQWTGFDGPRFPGTRQVSLRVSQELWPDVVEAYKVGTTPDAKIYLGGCRTGGLDRDERDKRYNKIPTLATWETEKTVKKYFTGSYVEELAQATGRLVVGPSGLTNWNRTTQAVNAMEGVGGAPQETRIAYPDGRAVQVDPGETYEEALADAPTLTIEPATARIGDDVKLIVPNFESERMEIRVNGGKARVIEHRGLSGRRGSEITVRVPTTAEETGRVTIVSGGHTIYQTFTVEGDRPTWSVSDAEDAADAITIVRGDERDQLPQALQQGRELVFVTQFKHPEIESFRVIVTSPEDKDVSFEWFGPMDESEYGHRTQLITFAGTPTGTYTVEAWLRTRRGETLLETYTFELTD